MFIMPVSSDLQLRDFIIHSFLLVFNMRWGTVFCLLTLSSGRHGSVVLGIQGNEFHSLAQVASSEHNTGLYHTHLFLGTPQRHIFGRGGE